MKIELLTKDKYKIKHELSLVFRKNEIIILNKDVELGSIYLEAVERSDKDIEQSTKSFFIRVDLCQGAGQELLDKDILFVANE